MYQNAFVGRAHPGPAVEIAVLSQTPSWMGGYEGDKMG